MKTLTRQTDLEAFLQSVAGADRSTLMLDYDGTLAPFVTDRGNALPYPGVAVLIDRIIRSGKTRVIVISGRDTDSIQRLLGLSEPVEIWGGHGAERLTLEGEVEQVQIDPEIEAFISDTLAWAEVEKLSAQVEVKPVGIAFHWRGLSRDDAESLRTRLLAWWQEMNTAHGLYLAEFDGGLELRISGIDKGAVVGMIQEDGSPNGPIAYLGDDETDEDAFRALGEHGLKVLVRPELRETGADLWLTPPEELLSFLERWVDSVA